MIQAVKAHKIRRLTVKKTDALCPMSGVTSHRLASQDVKSAYYDDF